MTWTVPQFEPARVDGAGQTIARTRRPRGLDFQEWLESYNIVNNWRSSHAFPLNTFQSGLRAKAVNVTDDFLVAQRIKRMSSIIHKLDRFGSMRLTQMQDIGGCRAVVPSVKDIYQVVKMYSGSSAKHKLIRMNDYIEKPQLSGYRGYHLVYRYNSDRKNTYNELKVEIQVRSINQHIWATAVEAMGIFLRQAFKSSLGEDEWLRFFALMGTAIALREGTTPAPNTPVERTELRDELRRYTEQISAAHRLETYRQTFRTLETPRKDDHFFLLNLNTASEEVDITGFKIGQLQQASDAYARTEQEIADSNSGGDAVLVSVDSIASLRRAYPNYFLDIRRFIEIVNEELDENDG